MKNLTLCRFKERKGAGVRVDMNAIKKKLHSKEYNFLRENPNLGNSIVLLTLGGSYAYGMEKKVLI